MEGRRGHEQRVWSDQRWLNGELTRRTLLRKAGALAFSCGSASLLAACGREGSTAATAVPGERSLREVGRELRSILGTPTGKAALAAETIDLGVAVALHGEGAAGPSQYSGIEMAREHISAAGGPFFFIHPKDLSAPGPFIGARAAHVFGVVGVPVCLTSLNADRGTMLHAAKQYRFLMLDGESGTGSRLEGRPYFYGLAANQPGDLFGGAFEVMKHRIDERGSTALVTSDQGDGDIAACRRSYASASARAVVPSKGFNVVRSGQADYNETIAALRQQDPSVILLNLFGFDAVSFMTQLSDSGHHPPVIGFFWDAESARLAGSAFDKFLFVGEHFDAEQPQNDWAKLFVSEYRSRHRGADPDQHVAKAYEDTFIVWELARRVRQDGGEIRNGPDYLAAFEQEPTFPSLYGAGGRTGSISVDKRTHAPSLRTLGAFEVKGGSSPKRFATFNIGGSDYTEQSA